MTRPLKTVVHCPGSQVPATKFRMKMFRNQVWCRECGRVFKLNMRTMKVPTHLAVMSNGKILSY